MNVVSRGTAAGLAGTTAMTVALWAERRLRPDAEDIDYDASPHVAIAASAVLQRAVRWSPQTPAGRKALFLAVHWGYGSLVGVAREGTAKLPVSPAAATLVFYAGCQAMAMSLFPTLGGTPPPWRWSPALLASSFGAHALYAMTVSAARRHL